MFNKKFCKKYETMTLERRLSVTKEIRANVLSINKKLNPKYNSKDAVTDLLSVVVLFTSLSDKKYTKQKHKVANQLLDGMFDSYEKGENKINKLVNNKLDENVKNAFRLMGSGSKAVKNSNLNKSIIAFGLIFTTTDGKMSNLAHETFEELLK